MGLAACLALGVVGAALAVAVSRVRGVCEGWTRTAMRSRDVVVLYGPAVVVALASGLAARWAWWPPIAAAALAFALFAGTGLTLTARAARR